MYNQFIIAGPVADPAGIRTAGDALEAFRRIAASDAAFVSRGDDSGTHRRERAIWQEAGFDPKPLPWYIDAGVGMGDALRLASNRGAYILTDEGTFQTLNDDLDLELLYAGDTLRLMNRYGIIIVHRPRRPAEADALLNWLTGPHGGEVIAGYGVQAFGRSLFHPVNEPQP